MTENEFDINNVADQPAENVTETAEPTAEAIAETIADINSDAAVAVAPIASAAPKKAKKKKDEYRVSNFDIIKNFHRYTAKEKKHYRYLFWHRIAGYVWPFFRAVIIFGLSFVILYPILYMISTSIRPQSEMNDPRRSAWRTSLRYGRLPTIQAPSGIRWYSTLYPQCSRLVPVR